MAGRDLEFEEFCAGVYPRLQGYLALYCGDRDVALDLAQEALARLYRDWRKVRRAESAGAWVFRVSTNLAHSHYRRKKIERRATAKWRRTEPMAGVADATESVALRDALRDLPPRQRQALLLRYYADLPVRLVAEGMSCPEGTVKSLLSRGIARLRETLGEELEEVSNG